LTRREDGGCGLDGQPHHNILTRRNAAQYAARVVGLELRLAVHHADFIGVLFTRHRGGGETITDLDALHRIDAHHGGGKVLVELAVDRRTPAGRNAGGDHLQHGAAAGTRLPHIVELNIGHAIIARAVLVGLDRAVREMVGLLKT